MVFEALFDPGHSRIVWQNKWWGQAARTTHKDWSQKSYCWKYSYCLAQLSDFSPTTSSATQKKMSPHQQPLPQPTGWFSFPHVFISTGLTKIYVLLQLAVKFYQSFFCPMGSRTVRQILNRYIEDFALFLYSMSCRRQSKNPAKI